MTNIIVSAHGGRWSDQRNNLTIPAGSSLIFYVADGGLLSNRDGYAILDNLQNGREPGGRVVEQDAAGNTTYDYSCWYASEFASHCGIFEVGSRALIRSLEDYTEDNPLLLSRIFHDYPRCRVYWVCCREITRRGTSSVLVNSPGSYLSQPKPQNAT